MEYARTVDRSTEGSRNSEGVDLNRRPEFSRGPETVPEVDRTGDTGRITSRRSEALADRAHEAYRVLHFAFIVAPIIAGLDKFFHILVNWDLYLSPLANRILAGNGHTFMMAAGVVEIIAGLGVAVRPRIFAYVVSAWLVLIIINLLTVPGYFDIALRDLGLALSAFALGRLSEVFDRRTTAS